MACDPKHAQQQEAAERQRAAAALRHAEACTADDPSACMDVRRCQDVWWPGKGALQRCRGAGGGTGGIEPPAAAAATAGGSAGAGGSASGDLFGFPIGAAQPSAAAAYAAALPQQGGPASGGGSITREAQWGGFARLYYPRVGPRGQHRALRAAMQSAVTATPCLPPDLTFDFLGPATTGAGRSPRPLFSRKKCNMRQRFEWDGGQHECVCDRAPANLLVSVAPAACPSPDAARLVLPFDSILPKVTELSVHQPWTSTAALVTFINTWCCRHAQGASAAAAASPQAAAAAGWRMFSLGRRDCSCCWPRARPCQVRHLDLGCCASTAGSSEVEARS